MNKEIIYLSGALPKVGSTARAIIEASPKLGYMVTPNMGNKAGQPQHWGADTGCFSLKGVRAFNEAKYLSWLESRDSSDNLFATAPDVVGDYAATLELAAPVLPKIRARGFRAALVIQEGVTLETVPWGTFDVLFIGGTDDSNFKFSPVVAQIVAEAKRRGLWVHMGRVNSYKRLAYAASIDCDSADGTFLKYGMDTNLPRMQSWFLKLERCPNQYRLESKGTSEKTGAPGRAAHKAVAPALKEAA